MQRVWDDPLVWRALEYWQLLYTFPLVFITCFTAESALLFARHARRARPLFSRSSKPTESVHRFRFSFLNYQTVHKHSTKTDLLEPERGERRQYRQLTAMSVNSARRSCHNSSLSGHSRPTTTSLLSTCALSRVCARARARTCAWRSRLVNKYANTSSKTKNE